MGIPGAPIDSAAFQRLYDELRSLASISLRAESDRGALQTTALVHEALLKLRQFEGGREWESKAHFFGAAARAMRQILVDEAKKRRAENDRLKILAEASETASREVAVLDLDEALSALAAKDEALARLVMLKVFAGLTVEEIAEMLDCAPRTVARDWQVARATILHWLMERGGMEGV